MKRVLLAACLVLAAPAIAPAAAEDAGETAARWGLLGTWALDCGRGASRANAHLAFVRVDGRLVHRRDFGDFNDEFPVSSARIGTDDTLEVAIDLPAPAERRFIVFARAGEGKKRAMVNRGARGGHTIRDGKYVATGGPTPVQTRCGALVN